MVKIHSDKIVNFPYTLHTYMHKVGMEETRLIFNVHFNTQSAVMVIMSE